MDLHFITLHFITLYIHEEPATQTHSAASMFIIIVDKSTFTHGASQELGLSVWFGIHVNCSQAIPMVWVGYNSICQPYPGYSLVMIYIRQTMSQV